MKTGIVSRRMRTGIVACMLGNLIDGFDVLAIAFTAPAIADDWNIGPEQLGAVFSAGVAGITIGSLLVAPFAERIGRRRLAITALVAMALAMLGCAFVSGVVELAVLRFITGLGGGAILPTLNSVAAELAPRDRRNVILSLFAAAYPLGSILGGGLAVLLTDAYGWRSIFVVGAAATAIVVFLQWAWLPGAAPSEAANPVPAPGGPRRSISLAAVTALLAVGFFFEKLAVFFVLNWTPRLVEQAGLGAQLGVAVGMVVNGGSFLGGLSYGVLADRFGWPRTAVAYSAGFAIFLASFGISMSSSVAIFAAAVMMGFLMGGSMTSLYALAPTLFPASARVGRSALVIGIGRIGGIFGPLLAGYGVAAGQSGNALYMAAAAAPIVVGGAILLLAARSEPDFTETEMAR